MKLTLETLLSTLPKVQKTYLPRLEKLGLLTVGDLLRHFPSRYDDYSAIVPIDELSVGETQTVVGVVESVDVSRTWRKKMIVSTVFVRDDTEQMRCVWFNQAFVAQSFPTGTTVRISGKVSSDNKGLYFTNPACERASREPTHTGRLVPVYPETYGLTSKWLRWQMQMVLESLQELDDPIPCDVRTRLSLPELLRAFWMVHFPSSEDEATLAGKRFAFEEMFLLQLRSLILNAKWRRSQSISLPFDEIVVKKFVHSLPFPLTDAQRKTSYQILCDIAKEHPMNRLVNGDVGTGKTAVSAIATSNVAHHGFQTVILAPTEVLARQHFETFSRYFPALDYCVGLFTGSYRQTNRTQGQLSRKEMLSLLSDGSVHIVIGTHALLTDDVSFKHLALVVVDEQHRFGVLQRARLQEQTTRIDDGDKTALPHFLAMTATPIPRTLTLALFGNLDVSVLDQMPRSRKRIITSVASDKQRAEVYSFLRGQISSGHQAYVILPLVEESETLVTKKAAMNECMRLQKTVFKDLSVALLHGRMSSKEKESVMNDFSCGKTNILVSTAVVEVGVDVPNATVMLIENADQFGLSQLHQFRGRIGRGTEQSYCFLFSDKSQNHRRLRALVKHSDGFSIAEEDLKLRGPGQFFGSQQSGIPDVAMSSLMNVKMVTIARDEARALLKIDPTLKKHPATLSVVSSRFSRAHIS
ncbi:MAG: ATP-dependent DNA helicase RecG [Candidatus Moranbacteria bacterium]|nr:ATP-dependent DNA helicase RecG [Candidatus Moranbacteria bacterium]